MEVEDILRDLAAAHGVTNLSNADVSKLKDMVMIGHIDNIADGVYDTFKREADNDGKA